MRKLDSLKKIVLHAVAVFGSATLMAGAQLTTITPTEDTTSMLRNPAMGWMLYLDAVGPYPNAQTYWQQLDPYAQHASIFYHRARWSDYEPTEGQYAWKTNANFRAMIEGARSRGLRLAFRVLINPRDNAAQATPDYVRQAGAQGYMETGQGGAQDRTPKLDDPVFQQKLDAFVAAFAAEFNDPAEVDFVDGNGFGWWGEIHHLNLSSAKYDAVYRWISGTYARHFNRVLQGIQYGSEFGLARDEQIPIGEFGFVIRRDALGSSWFTSQEKAGVLRQFPNVPFFGECCYYNLRTWDVWKNEGVSDHREILAWSMRDALDYHANTLDLRQPVDAQTWIEDAPELVQKFKVQGGYRLLPTRVSFPAVASAGGTCVIQHVWKNSGVGVLPNKNPRWNHKYRVAFALLNPSNGQPSAVYVDQTAEPGEWVKGAEFPGSLRARLEGIAPGSYQAALAIVDTTNQNTPAIQLAVTGLQRTADGWYVLGEINVNNETPVPLVGFNQTAAGPWDYNTTGNWIDGTINGIWDFAVTLSANQTVTFAADTSAGSGLSFDHAGNFPLLLQSSSTTARNLTLGGNISLNTSGGTTANATIGTSLYPLNINLGGATRTATVADNRTLTLANVVSNGGITKSGNGTLTLSGANTYLGNTTVNSGTLAITSTGKLYGSTIYRDVPIVTVNSGATLQVAAWAYDSLGSVGPLDFGAARMVVNGGTITYTGVGENSGTSNARLFTIGTGGATLDAAGAGTWFLVRSNTYGDQTIGNGLTLTLSGSANGQFSNVLAGSGGALAKSGTGTWTLSGANTYTGSTTVSAGTLLITGSTSTSSAVAVNGGDLGGTGTIGGSVTVAAAGNLAPGVTAGTLNITGNLNLSAMASGDGTLKLDLGALSGANDQIAVGGSLALGNLALDDLAVTNLGSLQAGTYTLITSTGLTGTVDGGTALIATGFNGKLQITGNNLELVVTVAASPYETWAGSGVAFDADANNDGVDNGMAWILGATHAPENAADKLPKANSNSSNLRLTFRCLKSTKRGGIVLKIQTSSDLGVTDPWTTRETIIPDTDSTVNGIDFDTTDDGNYVNVIADIPTSGSRIFARLKAE